jgi:hypothetical protein
VCNRVSGGPPVHLLVPMLDFTGTWSCVSRSVLLSESLPFSPLIPCLLSLFSSYSHSLLLSLSSTLVLFYSCSLLLLFSSTLVHSYSLSLPLSFPALSSPASREQVLFRVEVKSPKLTVTATATVTLCDNLLYVQRAPEVLTKFLIPCGGKEGVIAVM